jgi:hypothetical protein
MYNLSLLLKNKFFLSKKSIFLYPNQQIKSIRFSLQKESANYLEFIKIILAESEVYCLDIIIHRWNPIALLVNSLSQLFHGAQSAGIDIVAFFVSTYLGVGGKKYVFLQ